MFGDDLHYLSSFLTLTVPEPDAAAEWYGAAFGFVVVAGRMERGSPWLHLRRGEGQDIVLARGRHQRLLRAQVGIAAFLGLLGVRPARSSFHVAVDQASLKSLTDGARRAGGARVRPRRPAAKAAGAATVRDPYGYEWVFFRRVVPGGAMGQGRSPVPAERRR
jgi:uncharacterized glyoxalase superfamily protein PhnB